MMKTIKLTLIALLMLTAFTNCKKDKKEATPAITIDGTWSGVFSDNGRTYFFFITKETEIEGTLEVKNSAGLLVATGTWELTAGVFNAYYVLNGNENFVNGANRYATAKFDSQAGTLKEGTFGANNTFIGLGTWSMTKYK